MKTRHLLALAALIIIAGCGSPKSEEKEDTTPHLDFRGTPICGKLDSFTLPGYEEIEPEGKYEKVFRKGEYKVYVDFYGVKTEDKKAYNLVEKYPRTSDWKKAKDLYMSVRDSLAKIYLFQETFDTMGTDGRFGVYASSFKAAFPERGSVLIRVEKEDAFAKDGDVWLEINYFDKEGSDWVKEHK